VALFLIKIRRTRWLRSNIPPWVPPGDFPAALLDDLRVTPDGELSIWHIEDDRSNLQQVTTALAANRDHVSNIDYALFDPSLVSGLAVKVRETPGKTPYSEANRWHRDLLEVSAKRLLELAKRIFQSADPTRVLEQEVLDQIRKAVDGRRIDPKHLNKGISDKLSSMQS